MIVSGVKNVPDTEFLVLRTLGITGQPEFTEYLPGNSGRNFFFCIFVNSVSILVFEVADSEFCSFRLIRIIVFPDYRENTEFTGKFREKFFFSAFL